MEDILIYNELIQKLRFFFLKRGYVEVPTQSNLSILAACENPQSIVKYVFDGQEWPMIQTGQMVLEEVLLKNPDWEGVFCITTSYRDEKDPIPGRHNKVFPMFEFESKGGFEELKQLEKELLEYLGFRTPLEVTYEDMCRKYSTEIVEAEHETKMWSNLGTSVSLQKFPKRTSPFFNMKSEDGETFQKIDVILLPHADISLAKSHFSGKWYKMAYSFCQKSSAFLPGYGVKYIEKTNFIDLFGKSNQKGRDWFNWGRIRKKGFFYITKKVYLFIKSFLRRRYLTLENYLFFFKTREKRKIGFLLNGELCDLFCYMDINKLACFIGRLGSVFDTASGFCVVVKTKPRYTDKSWMDLVLHKFGIHSVYVVPNNFTIQDYARKIDLLVVSEFHTGVLKTMSNGIPCVAVSNIEFPVCIDQPYAFIPASILPTLSPGVILDLLKNKEALTSLASRQKDWSACQVGL